ncbi:hypothetical protein [Ovoidimarina sediminis]|uniref:hypothetical protein n=1 Tax=Ovoidimarina sediminis TaxID=3079856 RepID=UPI002912DBB6|nr:hypothetical protein [Rhodophyticola sp. MJ-SS7]MDU8943695.1 hypothetical protein [Rhodophyticola sp. MJ-SS7]
MLDATNMIQAATFRATDPAQAIYRGLLASFTDEQLAQIEEELGTFSRTGLVPTALEDLLNAGAEVPAAA